MSLEQQIKDYLMGTSRVAGLINRRHVADLLEAFGEIHTNLVHEEGLDSSMVMAYLKSAMEIRRLEIDNNIARSTGQIE